MLMRRQWPAGLGGLPSSGARRCAHTALMLAVKEGGRPGAGVTAATTRPNGTRSSSLCGGDVPAVRPHARFQARIGERDPVRAPWDAIAPVERDEGAVDRHIERILNLWLLDTERIRSERIRVALDCVNGAGGVIMPRLLSQLGCEVHAIGTEPNGLFHRDPEPTAGNLAALGELVRRSGARIGLAVDPDVDRLSLVDETGRPLGEDLTLALAADVVLRRRPGRVVTNLSTSRVLDDVAGSHGCCVIRAPVGEINVVVRMEREGAVVGGEGNGGVVLPELQHTRDRWCGPSPAVPGG